MGRAYRLCGFCEKEVSYWTQTHQLAKHCGNSSHILSVLLDLPFHSLRAVGRSHWQSAVPWDRQSYQLALVLFFVTSS